MERINNMPYYMVTLVGYLSIPLAHVLRANSTGTLHIVYASAKFRNLASAPLYKVTKLYS